ncbi:2-keto-4-pentenoate hydratase, partial [Nocardia sp. JW2]
MLSDAQRSELADELARAEHDRVAVPPLVDRYPGIDVVDAYEIQLLNIQRRLRDGAQVVGHKVGLSSKAM